MTYYDRKNLRFGDRGAFLYYKIQFSEIVFKSLLYIIIISITHAFLSNICFYLIDWCRENAFEKSDVWVGVLPNGLSIFHFIIY